MRYVIIGAGAIGGVLAARLGQFSADHPPLLIARGDNRVAIARDGLRLRTPDEDVVVPVETADGPKSVSLRRDDVLVIATKTQQVVSALDEWVDQPVQDDAGETVGTAGELLPLLVATNGVDAERMALRRFARVYGVCVWLPAVHLVPGEVIGRIAPTSGTFLVGRYPARSSDGAEAADDARLLDIIAADLGAARLIVHIVDDVMRWKYSKLLANLGNALQALLGHQDFSALADRVRAEAQGVLASSGIEWIPEDQVMDWRGDTFQVRHVPGTPQQLGGSTWQSLTRGGGSVETDYLNGEIALIARMNGLEAPLNDALQVLVRRAANAGLKPGELTVGELERVLGIA